MRKVNLIVQNPSITDIIQLLTVNTVFYFTSLLLNPSHVLHVVTMIIIRYITIMYKIRVLSGFPGVFLFL